MQFEADFIRLLQSWSNGFMDFLNEFLSFFGTEIFFMVVALAIYWVFDKRFGFRMFNSYILGVAVTNGMKVGFARLRPYYAYPDIKPLGEIETYNTSFPSGHTESIAAVATLTTIKYGKKYKVIPIVGALLVIGVMLARQYLGMHYLSDVICGLAVGMLCSIVFYALFSLFGDKEEFFAIPAIVLTIAAVSIFAGLNMLGDNTGAIADLLKGIGAFCAFDIGYFIEKRYVKYDITLNRKVWWKVLLRIVIGGGVAFGLWASKKLMPADTNVMIIAFVRYFALGLWASVLAPLIFKALKI